MLVGCLNILSELRAALQKEVIENKHELIIRLVVTLIKMPIIRPKINLTTCESLKLSKVGKKERLACCSFQCVFKNTDAYSMIKMCSDNLIFSTTILLF